MKRKIAIIITVLLFLIIYFLYPIETKRNIKLPSNKPYEIVNYLKNEGVGVTFLDTLFLKIFTKPTKGWVYINKNSLPRYKFLLTIGSKYSHYTPITIVPGETTYFVLRDISKKLNFNLKKLYNSYNKYAIYKEGNFLSNTYNIPYYFNEEKTIKFIIDKSFKEFKKISIDYYGKFKTNSWKKILIIASIIQKESASKEEMPIIASVIFNRLHKNMRLQMDGALNYGKFSHSKITPLRIKTDKTSYNTYKYKGLPKEPVCNVSKDAILSAIKPAKTNYLYFLKNSATSHTFSTTYKEHLKNIRLRKKALGK